MLDLKKPVEMLIERVTIPHYHLQVDDFFRTWVHRKLLFPSATIRARKLPV